MESNKKQIKFTNIPRETKASKTTTNTTSKAKASSNTTSKVQTSKPTIQSKSTFSTKPTISAKPFQHTFHSTGMEGEFQKSANALKNIIDGYGNL